MAHVPYPDGQMTAFRAALPHALMGNHHKPNLIRWTRALNLGDEDALIAILLLQCPNLQKLRLGDGDTQVDCVKTVLSLAAMKENMGRILPRLKYVELDLETTDLMDYIRLFMSLPSLTSLSVRNFAKSGLKGLFGDIIVPTLQPCTSNVRELRLHGEPMDHEVLYEVLQSCNNLTSISYDICFFSPHGMARRPPYQLALLSVMSALSSNNHHTLQSLTLRSCWQKFGKLNDWGSLAMSRPMENEAESILALMKTRTKALADRLRTRLKYMMLDYRSINATQYFREISFELERNKPSKLPSHGKPHMWETTDDREEDLVDGIDGLLCRKGLGRLDSTDPDYYAVSTREVRRG